MSDRFAPGTILAGRYRIVSPLGRGGMGEVYRAQDLRLGETLALKFLPAEVTDDRLRLERLAGEVRLGRRVSHPNVCRIHDLVEADGRTFLTMELVDGEDLSSLLRRIGRLPAAKALELSHELGAGLAAIHGQGIVHRDLKPANVMIDGSGRARITDFGLAGLTSELRQQRQLAGTLPYMAPEQLRHGESSTRSDLYALGLLIFEMFAGRSPFEAATVGQLLEAQRLPPRLGALVPGIDPRVEEVVASCLVPAAAERPDTATWVVSALPGGDRLAAAVAAGETPSPREVAAAGPQVAIRPAWAWALLAVVIGGLFAMAPLGQRTQLFHRVGVPKPPAVLADRGQELLGLAGLAAPFRDVGASFFETRRPENPTGDGSGLQLRFFVRVSPRPLEPRDFRFTALYLPGFSSLGRVTTDDPPLEVPGDALAILEPTGRLVELRIIPPEPGDGPGVDRGSPAWEPLLAATGVDDGSLEPATPSDRPPVPADRRLAWRAQLSGHRAVSIEAASYLGQPVWLRVSDAVEPGESPPEPNRPASRLTYLSALIGIPLVLVLGPRLVVLNLRRGRADRHGAVRLALFCCLAYLAAALLRMEHVPMPGAELQRLGTVLAYSTFVAILAAGVYLAMEPYVRRRWPETLIGWSRLVAGRVLDPLVGRDVLVGLATGVTMAVAVPLVSWVEPLLGLGGGAPLPIFHSALSNLSETAFYLLYSSYPALLNAIGFLFFLALSRATLRHDRAAFVALWILIAAPMASIGGASGLALARGLLMAAALVVCLTRCGLLASAVALWAFFVVGYLPISLDPTVWYFGRSSAVLALVAGAAVWSAHLSLGSRRLAWRGWFDD